MITLRNKLYESLLGDEDDLINSDDALMDEWIHRLGMVKRTDLSKFNSLNLYNTYDIVNGKVVTSFINPGYTSNNTFVPREKAELSIEDILPPFIDFSFIIGLKLMTKFVKYKCSDITTNNGLKKLSKYPIQYLELSYGSLSTDDLDFNLVGNKELKALIIRANFIGHDKVLHIKNAPKFKLKSFAVRSNNRPILLDEYQGMNCDDFIFEGAFIKNNGELYKTIHQDMRGKPELLESAYPALDRFFKNNKINRLIFMTSWNLNLKYYQIVPKLRGGGYKLTKINSDSLNYVI